MLVPFDAPFTLLGTEAGEADDGPFGRGTAAGLPEFVLLVPPGVSIGGRGTEWPLGRLMPPVNDGRMTAGDDFSRPVDFEGCCAAFPSCPF